MEKNTKLFDRSLFLFPLAIPALASCAGGSDSVFVSIDTNNALSEFAASKINNNPHLKGAVFRTGYKPVYWQGQPWPSLIAQLPSTLLLTRERVLVLLQASSIAWASMISTPLYMQQRQMYFPMSARSFAKIAFRPYFGVNTMWYLQSHFVCERLDTSSFFRDIMFSWLFHRVVGNWTFQR